MKIGNNVQLENRRNMITDGEIMQNNRSKHVEAFFFLGSQYSTNFNRIKEYSMDDKGWKIKEQNHTFPLYFFKVCAILTKSVHKLKK